MYTFQFYPKKIKHAIDPKTDGMQRTQMSFCFYNASSIFLISSEEGRGA